MVWPQEGLDLAALEAADFTHHFLQPMDDNARLGLDAARGPHNADNMQACIAQCMARPAWRLSLQTHKVTGIR